MVVLGDGDRSDKEDILQGEGNFKVDPDSDNGHYPEEIVEEMNGPSTLGRGCGCGRKMQRGSGCGGGRGRGQRAQAADGELIRVSCTFISLMLLTVRFFTMMQPSQLMVD